MNDTTILTNFGGAKRYAKNNIHTKVKNPWSRNVLGLNLGAHINYNCIYNYIYICIYLRRMFLLMDKKLEAVKIYNFCPYRSRVIN